MIFFLLSTVRSSKDAPRIEYEHIFTSPWCCDASEESQYRAMMESLTSLNMDEGECTLFLLAAMFDTSGKSICLFICVNGHFLGGRKVGILSIRPALTVTPKALYQV